MVGDGLAGVVLVQAGSEDAIVEGVVPTEALLGRFCGLAAATMGLEERRYVAFV